MSWGSGIGHYKKLTIGASGALIFVPCALK